MCRTFATGSSKFSQKLELLPLEDRIVPASHPLIVVGMSHDGLNEVSLVDAETGAAMLTVVPFETSFEGDIHLALGDVTGDQFPDVITTAGTGGGPRVRVFDGKTGEQVNGAIGNFFAYDETFTGGVNVASGDINGDGIDDVVTVAEQMGGPHVRAFDGKSGAELGNFFAFEEEFQGGVNLAVGDLNGDGKAEVVVGAGAGGAPRVRVFDPTTWTTLNGPLGDFYAFDAGQRGGVKVAVGDINSDGQRDLITAPAAGNIGAARLFDGATGAMFWEALPFGPTTLNGVQVSDDIIDADFFETVPGNSVEDELRRHVVNDDLSDFPINFASAPPLDQSEINALSLVATSIITNSDFCKYLEELISYAVAEARDKIRSMKNYKDNIKETQDSIDELWAWQDEERKDLEKIIANYESLYAAAQQARDAALDLAQSAGVLFDAFCRNEMEEESTYA